MKRGKRCFVQSCLAPAPFASPLQPDVHACEVHKKRDFVNMRNKRCLEPGCYRNPHYGVSRLIDPNSKAQYCTKHKAPGMQNVNGGRCAGPDCSKQPRFSLPGEKGKYCSKHRKEGMVDVLYTPCAAEGCRKHPHFGHVEGGPRYCAQHRAEGMVDVKHRRCAVKSCRKDRVVIPGSAKKRGKFCEIHCDVNELVDKDVSSDATASDKKRGRAWMTGIEDDREYMSSESSQRGSSVGDLAGNTNMPFDFSSSRSASIPSIHEAAQGLAHLAMLASRERALSVGGEAAGTSLSRGHGHVSGRAPYEQAGQPESIHRGTARPTIAGRGPSHSDAELDRHAKSGDTRPFFYPAAQPGSQRGDPYPLFKRERLQSNDPLEHGRPRMSPDFRGSNSASNGSAPASAAAPPFRLRYFDPKPNSSMYSAYPSPSPNLWDYSREGERARWADGDSVRAPVPMRAWDSRPSAT
ncbi:unnamed protein product [Ectocarpus fasciculatus]